MTLTKEGPLSPLHAGCVSISGKGVLIIGPSGSGKSDLALRLIDRGALLVSDDYTDVHPDEASANLIASAPARISGLIEIRGIGPIPMPFLVHEKLAMVVGLIGKDEPPAERYPAQYPTYEIWGHALPLIHIAPFEASAPIKVEYALKHLASRDMVGSGR